jgi:ATP-dependent DNA ligase
MVIEVKYLNRTENGLLRMPDFLRERPDKKPSEVTLKTDADANIL